MIPLFSFGVLLVASTLIRSSVTSRNTDPKDFGIKQHNLLHNDDDNIGLTNSHSPHRIRINNNDKICPLPPSVVVVVVVSLLLSPLSLSMSLLSFNVPIANFNLFASSICFGSSLLPLFPDKLTLDKATTRPRSFFRYISYAISIFGPNDGSK